MKWLLKRLRLGEILSLVWLGVAATIVVLSGRWESITKSGYFPFAHVFMIAAVIYLTKLALVMLRRVGAAAVLLRRGPSPPPNEPQRVDFEEELRLTRDMGRFLRDCAPLYIFLLLYPTAELISDTLQKDRFCDNALIAIDLALFGTHPSVWAERFITPTLTDIMRLCYFLHLLLPEFVMVVIALRGNRAIFVETIEAFLLISIIGTSLFVLVPAVGPEHTLAHLYTRDLSGGTISEISRATIANLRISRDCFPSLHIGISAVFLVYAWRSSRIFGLLLLPFMIGNWTATIYLRYHYGIDDIAGAVLVPVIVWTVSRWHRAFPLEPREEVAQPEVPPALPAGGS